MSVSSKPVELSPIWTPIAWFWDLALEARLNRKYYTHDLGCWLAALKDRVPKGAKEKGNRWGSLLLRWPLGRWILLLVAVGTLPYWYAANLGPKGDVRQGYSHLYLATWMEGQPNLDPLSAFVWRKAKEHGWVTQSSAAQEDGRRLYPVWVDQRGELLTSGTTSQPGVHRARAIVQPAVLNRWVNQRVFGGAIWKAYLFLCLEVIGTMIVCGFLGRFIDWRRRVKAMSPGIFCRGAKLVSIRQWNRRSVGPWYLRKKIGMYLRVSANGTLARISTLAMTTHWLNLAKTGAGKTVMVREILDQADTNGWVVVVSDAKRELLKRYYRRERGDLAVDPNLELGVRWAIEREVRDVNEGRGLAAGIFPNRPGEINFFRDFSEQGLAYVLANYSEENAPKQKLKEVASTKNVAKWLRDPKTFIFPRSKGAGMQAGMNPNSGDQSAGMEGTLARVAFAFGMMPDESESELCIREWVERLNRGEQPGWIFFPTGGTTEKAVKPVITAMLNYLILRLRDTAESAANRRQVVLLLDEITTSFDHVEEIEVALTNLRSFGVLIVVGVHNYCSLKNMYGDNGTETILSQPGIQFVGKTDGKEAAEYAAGVVGKQEVWRLGENFPGTAGDKHRSVNFKLDLVERQLVMADEVSNLEPLNGFLRQGSTVCRVRVSYRPSTRPEQHFAERRIPMSIEDEELSLLGAGLGTVVMADGGPDIKAVHQELIQVREIVKTEIEAKRKLRLLVLTRNKRSQEQSLVGV